MKKITILTSKIKAFLSQMANNEFLKLCCYAAFTTLVLAAFWAILWINSCIFNF